MSQTALFPAFVLVALQAAGCSDDGGGTGQGGEGAASGATTTTGDAGGGPGPGGGAQTSSAGGGTGDGGGGGGPAGDLDQDGLDDADEAQLALSYRPFLSLHPDDECTLSGIVYRVRPHPTAAGMIHILYDHLFEQDCGLNGHPGDNEAFGVTIDPAIPPPAGILSIVTIGHQGTFCEAISMCGSCGDLDPCDTAPLGGEDTPVVLSSQDKHAGYLNGGCGPFQCFDTCEQSTTSADPPMINVGEPEAPLVSNLTTEAFINAENGWTAPEVMNIDPWDETTDFGSAGNIAGDLVDPAFVPPCP